MVTLATAGTQSLRIRPCATALYWFRERLCYRPLSYSKCSKLDNLKIKEQKGEGKGKERGGKRMERDQIKGRKRKNGAGEGVKMAYKGYCKEERV